MSDVATISLRVNTTDLERGNKALDEFQNTAGNAAKKSDDLNASFRNGSGSTKQTTAQIREQKRELQNLLNQISPVNKALDELDSVQSQLSKFRGGGLLGGEQYERYSEILETTRTRLLAVQDAETAEGRALQEQARQAERAAAASQSFVASLESQVNAIGKTRSELLELKAAELGVTAQTAPLIARLREQDDAWKRGEISAGQYRQAMRQLPAQITDVVTSLAGGQPVWLVAIQQGGQIKDSFGGIGNAAKALLSFINPMNVVLGVVAATMGAVAIHARSSQKEIAGLRDSISQNLGASGDDAQKLAVNIRAIAEASNKATDEVQKAFITTKDGASEAIEKLISVGSSYADARAKVEQYKGASDFTALNGIIEQHKLAIAGISDGWTDAAKKARDYYAPTGKGLGNIALGGAYDPVQAARQQAEEFEARSRAGFQQVQEQGKQAADQLDKQYFSTNRLAGAERQLQELLKQRAKASAVGDKQAVDRANYLIDQQQKAIDKIKAGDAKKPTTNKGNVENRQDLTLQRQELSLRAQLQLLNQQATVTGAISAERRKYLTNEAEIATLEKKQQESGLNIDEQRQLATDKRSRAQLKINADLGDEVKQKQRSLELDKQATTFAQQQQAIRDGIAIRARGGTDRDVQRAQQRSRIQNDPTLDDKTRNSELAQLRETYQVEDDLRANWLAGAKNAWAEYQDTATNVYSSIHDVAAATLSGLSGMLDDLMTTGTASLKNFAQSMLKMIVQVIDRLLVAYAIQSALGWVGGGSGGSTPSGSYTSSAANLQFDRGGYTGPGGKYDPAGIVHRGEFVFTKEATSAIGVNNLYAMMRGAQGYADGGYVGRAPMAGMNSGAAAGGGIVVNTTVNVDANGGSTAQSGGSGDSVGRALGAEIQNAALQVVQKQLKNGGIIYNFVKGR